MRIHMTSSQPLNEEVRRTCLACLTISDSTLRERDAIRHFSGDGERLGRESSSPVVEGLVKGV
eukprot:6467771-Pyramimonas_sp.AAC.1